MSTAQSQSSFASVVARYLSWIAHAEQQQAAGFETASAHPPGRDSLPIVGFETAFPDP
jgi:hypothetical protein